MLPNRPGSHEADFTGVEKRAVAARESEEEIWWPKDEGNVDQ